SLPAGVGPRQRRTGRCFGSAPDRVPCIRRWNCATFPPGENGIGGERLRLTATASARPLEILLVEDNPGDVRLVVEALRHGKLLHRLSVAENGAKALAMLRREGAHAHRAGPDLILLDLNLPGLSGHELLTELKTDARLARIPVVVMTGSDAQDDIARAYESH